MIHHVEGGQSQVHNLDLLAIARDYESDNPTELSVCIQEDLSRIMRLGVNDSVYIQPNRDDDSAKAIILRVE